MGLFWGLLLLFGVFENNAFYLDGYEYAFDYQGKIISGIPEIDDHYAGLMMQGEVILQSMGTNNFQIAVKNISYIKFNKRFSEKNWKTIEIPKTNEILHNYETSLEYPVQFTMVNGNIKNIKVSQDESDWALNLKKALISIIKIQLPFDEIHENQVRNEYISSSQKTWKTFEVGIDGECENTYQMFELPEYMLEENEHGNLNSDNCKGKQILQIIKSRDFNNCMKRSDFQINQPGRYLCLTGNCDSMWQRSSLTRYIACGVSYNDMEIQKIINEGEILQSMLGYNTENVVTGTRQALTLKESRDSVSYIPEIHNPKYLDDIHYEYPGIAAQNKRKPKRDTMNDESSNDDLYYNLAENNLKLKIMKKLIQIERDLNDVEKFSEKQISAHVLAMSSFFSLLKTEQMKSLYEDVKGLDVSADEKESLIEILLEVSVMTGTNSAVFFLKDLIQSEEISPFKIGVILGSLPQYILTPSVHILDALFEIIKDNAVTKHKLLKLNAELAFSTIVYRACFDKNRSTRFPVFVVGELCNSETSEIVTQYIPYFADQLNSSQKIEERLSFIHVLGNIGHESVLPIFLSIIEKQSNKNSLEQRIALYAMNQLVLPQRKILFTVYSSIVHNPAEDRSNRIVALSMLLTLQPSMTYFQKLATSTWFEKDPEFHKFVFSTLKSLSAINHINHPSYENNFFPNANKAKNVMHLLKPIPSVISSSLDYFTADWLKDLEVGYLMHTGYEMETSWEYCYIKLEYFLKQLKFSPAEFSYYRQGSSHFMDIISKIFGLRRNYDSKNMHQEWKNIISLLNIKSNKNFPPGIGFWGKVFDDIRFIISFNDEDFNSIFKSIMTTISYKNCGSKPFNFVKINDLAPTEILLPSDIGLPILIEFHMPAVFSTQGDVQVVCSSSSPTMTVDLRTKFSVAYTGTIGTICPFSKEVINVGIDQQFTMNVPISFQVKNQSGKINLEITSSRKIQDMQSNIDILAYKIQPFSSIKPLMLFDGIPSVSHVNTKQIVTKEILNWKTFSLENLINVDLKYFVKSDSEFNDWKSILDRLEMYNNNPLNMVLFGWTNSAVTRFGKPSCRYHEYRFVYNPHKSVLKKIQVGFAADIRYKTKNDIENTIQPEHFKYKSDSGNHYQVEQFWKSNKIDHGVGLKSVLSLTLTGETTKNLEFELWTGKGSRGMDEIWFMQIDNKNNFIIFINASVTLPSISLRNLEKLKLNTIRIPFRTNIQFGKTGTEHFINIEGIGSALSGKKDFGDSIKDKCEVMVRIQEELVQSQDDTKFSRQHEEKLLHALEKRILECDTKAKHITMLDEWKMHITYGPMPKVLKEYAQLLSNKLQSFLAPFSDGIKRINEKKGIVMELNFDIYENTFNVLLEKDDLSIKYKNIRILKYLANNVPPKASLNLKDQMFLYVQGLDSLPKCRVGDQVITTFISESYRYELDDCYHVLVHDEFQAILSKQNNSVKEMKVYTHGSRVHITPFLSNKKHILSYEIHVDKKHIQLKPNTRIEVQATREEFSYKLYRSPDEVIVLETPYSRIYFDNNLIEIEKLLYNADSENHGLCGNSRSTGMHSSQACYVKSPQGAALSYRIQQHCTPLSSQQLGIMVTEGRCSVSSEEKLQVSTLLKAEREKCSQPKHLLIKLTESLCISQIPVLECGGGCSAQLTSTIMVPFTCLSPDRERVTRLYEDKVMRGEVLPELRFMERKFSTQVHVPASCQYPNL